CKRKGGQDTDQPGTKRIHGGQLAMTVWQTSALWPHTTPSRQTQTVSLSDNAAERRHLTVADQNRRYGGVLVRRPSLDTTRWNLLSDAVDVTPSQQHLTRSHTNHPTVGEYTFQTRQRLSIRTWVE